MFLDQLSDTVQGKQVVSLNVLVSFKQVYKISQNYSSLVLYITITVFSSVSCFILKVSFLLHFFQFQSVDDVFFFCLFSAKQHLGFVTKLNSLWLTHVLFNI